MIDLVLSGEFHLAVLIAAIESHAALGQRYAQMVRAAVGELAHHPHVRVGLRPVLLDLPHVLIAAEIPVEPRAIVNIQPLRLYAGSVQKLHLLGLPVVNRRRLRKRVEVVVFERPLRSPGAVA